MTDRPTQEQRQRRVALAQRGGAFQLVARLQDAAHNTRHVRQLYRAYWRVLVAKGPPAEKEAAHAAYRAALQEELGELLKIAGLPSAASRLAREGGAA